LRASTGEQTIKNQHRKLGTAAERHGWTVGAIFEDVGISGARGEEIGQASMHSSRQWLGARSTW
jgi:DNA invertase Pin-like site-specific DNA recombinase